MPNPRLFSKNQFSLVKRLCEAPSPVGFEASMTRSVVLPEFERFMPKSWKVNRFIGNAGLVIESSPNIVSPLNIMIIGHADKIRLQVRSVSDDGKIWVNTDSFLPASIINDRFDLYVEDPDNPGNYKVLRNLTAQTFGAVHFADGAVRSGRRGVDPDQVYLESGVYGKNRKEKLEDLGVRPGQTAIFARKVERAPTKGTFFGPYLDNALGCFAVIEVARKLAEHERLHGPLKNGLRIAFTVATHEEIGLFGSTVAAGVHRPDIVIGVDVNHDYEAAPNIGNRRMQRLAMGEGCTLSSGTVHSYNLLSIAERAAREEKVPYQKDFSGRRAGNDSMAGALSAIDAASFSVGFPIRNMHTSSELAYDGDVLAGVDLIYEFIMWLSRAKMDPSQNSLKKMLMDDHISLSESKDIDPIYPSLS